MNAERAKRDKIERAKRDKIEFIKAMHTIVCGINNEEYYYNYWVNIMVDCPDDQDIEWFAENENEEEFEELAAMFEYIMTEACKEEKPFYIGGTCI